MSVRAIRPAPQGPVLTGRAAEVAVIDRMLDGARTGRSAAVVVRGEAGIGKSALLRHAGSAAIGMRVLDGTGYHLHKAFPKLGVASRAQLASLRLPA